MNNYYIDRTDLYIENNIIKNYINNNNIKIYTCKKEKYTYKTINYNRINNQLINILTKELIYFFHKNSINYNSHILVVGLGNDNYTADSVGPKTLKHIKVNSYLENIGIKIKGPKVSALEPGVLGETGILTEKIIKSIVNDIKPDLVILIDSYVSRSINFLNKTIQISDEGMNTGHGLKGLNSTIDKKILKTPIIIMGVVTAIEIKFTKEKNKNYIPYLLSTKDIDNYVTSISEIVGNSINNAINYLK